MIQIPLITKNMNMELKQHCSVLVLDTFLINDGDLEEVHHLYNSLRL